MIATNRILTDPFLFASTYWPDLVFYDKQAEIIQSVADDDMTVVPAGNMLGKDFVAGFIITWFFCSRWPCRIITTSAKDDHLRVLWGELKRFIHTAKYPLARSDGGPLIVNHREIRRDGINPEDTDLSYIRGAVASTDSIASMQGHHIANRGDGIPRTLFVSDESSSVPDEYWTMARTWAKRALIIGNPWPCSNFFYKSVRGDPATNDRGGDIYNEDGRCYRKVIRIRAEDSPNVRLGLLEKEKGRKPSNRVIIEGVKDYDEYAKNRATWDPIQQCVSLDGDFYEGAEVKFFPVVWLNRAASLNFSKRRRRRRYMGVDTGEGGDDTVWTIIDEVGILFQEAMKTPDTSIIPNRTVALMKQYGIKAADVLFDRGGGGYEHVCELRNRGYKVRSIDFGGAASSPFIERRMKQVGEREEEVEIKYVYKNRRAEMYGLLRQLIHPELNPKGFHIPARYAELRRQLQPLPWQFDEEGRIWLPPKNKKDPNSKIITLKELLGCSPDEADSTVLAVYAREKAKTEHALQVAS